MAWWTRIPGRDPEVEKHDTKLGAAIALNFAVNVGEAKVGQCALYNQNPVKHPETRNLLPETIDKASRSRRPGSR